MRRDHIPDVTSGQPHHRSACPIPLHSQRPAGTAASALGPRRTARPVGARRCAPELDVSAGDCSGLARGSLGAAFRLHVRHSHGGPRAGRERGPAARQRCAATASARGSRCCYRPLF